MDQGCQADRMPQGDDSCRHYVVGSEDFRFIPLIFYIAEVTGNTR